MVCPELCLTFGMGHFVDMLLILSCGLFCEECSELRSEPTGASEVGLFADASLGSAHFSGSRQLQN